MIEVVGLLEVVAVEVVSVVVAVVVVGGAEAGHESSWSPSGSSNSSIAAVGVGDMVVSGSSSFCD